MTAPGLNKGDSSRRGPGTGSWIPPQRGKPLSTETVHPLRARPHDAPSVLQGSGRVSVQRPQSPLRFSVLTKDPQNSGSVPHSGSRFSEVPVSGATRWEGGPGRDPACSPTSLPRGSHTTALPSPRSDAQQHTGFRQLENSSQPRLPGFPLGVRQVDAADLTLQHLPGSSQCGGPGPP